MAINPADRDSRLFTLTKSECSIGSDESNDLVIRDSTVSRRHATIRRRRRRWELIDLGSTNGTFADNNRISGSVILRDGQDVRFGNARLVFHRTAPSQPKGARTLARPLRRRSFRLRTAIELIIVAFVFGFAGTQYFSYINYRHLADRQRAKSKPVPSPTFQTAPKTAPAAHASPAPLWTESSVSNALPSWLRRLNYWRSITNLRTVTENVGLSDGARRHSRYLVKHALQDNTARLVGADMHSEDPRNAWYTAAGLAAGKNGDVDPPCRGCQLMSDDQYVDIFVNAPFHRFRALDPDADRVGYGSYSEAAVEAATLNVPLSAVGQGTFSAPIEFPAPGSIVPLSAFQGEWPDPLASCTGYKEPAGLAVTLELGRWITVTSTAHSFSQGNKILASCALDASSYTNADQQMREFVRDILKTWGAVIVIPREPLTSGTDYSISITANDKDYKWSFTVE